MFSHMMVGSNDIARSKLFYDALFAAMGAKPGRQDDKGRLVYAHKGNILMVTSPIDGEPATHGNGSTIGFTMDCPAARHRPLAKPLPENGKRTERTFQTVPAIWAARRGCGAGAGRDAWAERPSVRPLLLGLPSLLLRSSLK